ncbi:cysteine hydrolase family protein [Kocuria rosea]|uniref:cysteine hydrolase family protein n=1 Tax=Kocuria rosea TaxID=1275 RepID=UPI0025B78F98|nr:isochorismatase family cysteine hydrolase [Kocuria rosea]WJZ66354.1 isochorismatase family cysteine hydrolase [Kocuria rosea]
MELNPSTTAVLTIHCQGDIVGPEGAFAPLFHGQVLARGVIDKIRDLHQAARQAGSLVVYTRVAWAPDYSDLQANSPLLQGVVQAGCLKEGSPQAAIVEPLAPQEGDAVITHQRVGGWTPELTAVLQDRGIDTLLFCGVATNVSVESTARAASDAGYRVVVVEDACSAATAQAHQATVESLGMLSEIATVDEVRQALGSTDRLTEAGP